jgi:hypothetical protein
VATTTTPQAPSISALPDTATSISDGGYNSTQDIYTATFDYFTALKSFSGNGLTSIGDYAFYNCMSLNMTSLPEGVTYIGEAAFQDCTNLALISLPAGISHIGNSAFYGCTNITLTSMPMGGDTEIRIENYAFACCDSLTEIIIPQGVQSIHAYVFVGCINLTAITLPSTLNHIEGLFQGLIDTDWNLNSLVSFTCFATTPPEMEGYPKMVFPPEESDELEYVTFDYTPNVQIKVPAGSVNAYKTATGWIKYADRIVAIE